MIDADWLRALCLEAGADDAAAVSLDHPDLAGERDHVLAALPGTRALVSLMVRMNRANTRSPARSVANQEFHQTDEQVNAAARRVVRALEDAAAIARSIRPPGSRRRWSTSPAVSGSSRTRRSPWPRAWASWGCTAMSSTPGSAISCCSPPCSWTPRSARTA
ncbi:hypothetical protein ACQ4WX_46360 [Streptomyces lasalocidi]